MLGGDGDAKLGSDLKGQQVTAKVAEHVRGKKVIVGKHRRRTGYKRRNGFRAALTRIEVQSIGATRTRSTAAKEAETGEAKPAAPKKPAARKTTTTRARKPAAATEKKAPARRAAPKKTEE